MYRPCVQTKNRERERERERDGGWKEGEGENGLGNRSGRFPAVIGRIDLLRRRVLF